MNRNRSIARLALLVGGLSLYLLGAGLWGCSSSTEEGRDVAAQVGNRSIELRQITDVLTAFGVDYPTADKELEARKKELDVLIENELLIIGAYSQALDADIGIIELVDREKDKFLLDELFRHEVMDKAVVTDDQIKELYSHWFDRVRMAHILVKTKAEADSLLALVKAGGDFGDLAEANSLDKQTAVGGGDFGRDFAWGELIPSLRDLAFNLKDRESGGPIQSDYGWHIIHVKSHSKIKEKPLDELWTPLQTTLKRQAMEKLRLAQLDSLRARANIKLVQEGLGAFRNQVSMVSDSGSGTLLAQRNIPVDSLSGTVKDLDVASYGRDGVVTVGQMADWVNSRPVNSRADMSDDDQVKEAVFQIGLFDLLRDEALRLRMDEQPLYQERLVEFREKLMADKMRNSIVSKNLRLPEEDVRGYFDAHPDSFIQPTGYHVREVMVHDSMLARRILAEARKGTPLKDLASRYTERTGFKKSGGDLGIVSPNRYPDLYKPASTLKEGEVGGPYAGVDQYSVIEVLDTQPPRPLSYDEVQPKLFKRLQDQRTDSIITAYADSMKILNPVVIHEDVLRKDLHVTASEAQPTESG